ncbi:hypothetical protein BC827DRAFT_684090 [Russula dissimulans]|nr:hypothetical protein BC827DRAFT_684090 [Russula dissimulans]
MDDSTPLTVAAGTIASSISGALIAGTYALVKRRGQAVASIYAASAAHNCGIAGATFLSIRGYVVMPFLDQVLSSRQHWQENIRRAPALSEVSGDGAVTWGAMRSHRTLDAALSGGITGSVLNTWRRGTRGAFTGMVFGSVFCTLGQVLYNELGVQRIKFISRRYAIPSRPPTPVVAVLPEPPVPKQPLLDRMMHAVGLKKLSDEEYIAQMKEERAMYLRRIAKLEAQSKDDKNSEHLEP